MASSTLALPMKYRRDNQCTPLVENVSDLARAHAESSITAIAPLSIRGVVTPMGQSCGREAKH
jgi:hypothetical protein